MQAISENRLAADTKSREETRLAWLALALTPGLGPKRILDAMGQIESPADILTLPLTTLEGVAIRGRSRAIHLRRQSPHCCD